MVDVRRVVADELARFEGDLVALLEQRYGPSPWHESTAENVAQARHLVESAAGGDTVTAIALDGDDLVGLAQGGPGSLFAADLRAADPDAARAWDPPVFELHQLLVSPSVAGSGIGGRLHDAVMGAVTGPALLLTHPDAEDALGLYERRAWVVLARTSFGPGYPRVILGRRPLPPARSR
jgi:GNAT superfamily N-acetyltransferase